MRHDSDVLAQEAWKQLSPRQRDILTADSRHSEIRWAAEHEPREHESDEVKAERAALEVARVRSRAQHAAADDVRNLVKSILERAPDIEAAVDRLFRYCTITRK